MQTSLPYLTENPAYFPNPSTALTEPNGLLAMGGDLSPERLISAYQQGIFPWYDETSPILWWSPNPRAILWLDDLIIHKSLKKLIHNPQYTYKADSQFEAVIEACSQRTQQSPNLPATWITPELKEAYTKLHKLGYAHSIEIYINEQLVGGLYGITLGQTFFGESMFHKEANCSKIALVFLVRQLKRWGFRFIDCQVWSSHLGSLGATEIPREQYLQILQQDLKFETKLGNWQLDPNLREPQ